MRILAGITLLMVLSLQLRADDFPVTSYGAVGDGVTLNTTAIQKAIDACAGTGGGRVLIGPGTFLSGTLVMRSHVELHLEQGATLLGSADPGDYPEMTTPYRFYGDEWVKQSLIFAYMQEDIALTGAGVIDGQGAAFQVSTKKKPDRYRNRPYLIRFTRCRRVNVTGLTLQNSAMWMQHYLACDDVNILGVTVFNHCNKNNDMIDIDGCRNVRIEDCTGDTDDDGLTLKSTSGRACENVSISNCTLSSHCNAVKLGTESTGGFKNISIRNCVIKPSAMKKVIYGLPEGISGISLELVDGGVMDNISISGVTMDGPEVPIFIRLGNRARPHKEGIGTPGVGSLGQIQIENIVARNAGKTGCSITGLAAYPARNISLRNLSLHFREGVNIHENNPVPEMEAAYPESTMFGVLPASVLYMRHLENIHISDMLVEFEESDVRDHLVLENVKGFSHEGLRISSGEEFLITENKKE